jgi:hypothetical protein
LPSQATGVRPLFEHAGRPCGRRKAIAKARDWQLSVTAAPIATQISAISREIHAIAAQITPDGVYLALFLPTPRVPLLGGTEVAMFNGPQLAPLIVVTLRALFPKLGFIAANVSPVAPDVANVATDIARRGRRYPSEHEGCRSRGDHCNVSHDGNSVSVICSVTMRPLA